MNPSHKTQKRPLPLVVALAEWVMWCGVRWLSVGLLVTGSSLG